MEANIEQLLTEIKSKVKIGYVYYDNSSLKKQFSELVAAAIKIFPEEKDKLVSLKVKVLQRPHGPFGADIINACEFVEKIIVKKESKTSKSFLRYPDLLKEAQLALRRDQQAYAIHLCDSAIEAFLKEMLDIRSTIVGAGTVKFISECIILNIPNGIELHLKEAKNKVCQLDNQIKHKAYVPSKLDAINALKVIEELLSRKERFKSLNEEEKKKIWDGIGIVQN